MIGVSRLSGKSGGTGGGTGAMRQQWAAVRQPLPCCGVQAPAST